MSTAMNEPGERELNLQPHPRILPMLGEINLEQWRCIAELIDNSVDSFISAKDAGHGIEHPSISISIPTSQRAEGKVTVRDNGPGMDADSLENAVRAGWTSNDPINSLGLFGMGFNIATARLGTRTRVWSTRAGDAKWWGLEIDFEKLIGQRHYKTALLTRPKSDPSESGTEVTIDRLKQEQLRWLARRPSHARLRDQFSRTYAAMLRADGVPLTFSLTLNNEPISPREPCVWGGPNSDTRQVTHSRFGEVNAFQEIDVELPARPYCTRCWEWLQAGDDQCFNCEKTDSVVSRPRKIRGWLGIQRYLSKTDFGIDLLRNGRKIELDNRDLFSWSQDGDKPQLEYPIDDPRSRGRIVGELHLDHCRVPYTKNRFDRDDPAWAQMLMAVRGEGPLTPQLAAQQGFGGNDSPLFRLFQLFRRSSPKPKIAGCYAKLLVIPDNERAEEMAQKFYEGNPEFASDAKWWELVEEADRELLKSEQPDPGPPGFDDDDDSDDDTNTENSDDDTGGSGDGDQEPETPPVRTAIASLSRDYRDEHTDQRWEVQAFDVGNSDHELDGSPWRLVRRPSGIAEFLVASDHEVYRSATLTPLDALLCELAHMAIDFARGTGQEIKFSRVLSDLRSQYAKTMALDPVAITSDAAMTLGTIAKALSGQVEEEDSRALFNGLSSSDQEAIQTRMATRGVSDPQSLISNGRFLEFASSRLLQRFFESHPELFLDGKYWDDPYDRLDFDQQSATEEARSRLVRYYSGLMADAIWLTEQEPDDIALQGRVRVLRATLSAELLSPTSEQLSE